METGTKMKWLSTLTADIFTCLPPCIHNMASPSTNLLIVPLPCYLIQGLASWIGEEKSDSDAYMHLKIWEVSVQWVGGWVGEWERGESFLSVFVLWVDKSTHSYVYAAVCDDVHCNDKYTRNKWAPFKVCVLTWGNCFQWWKVVLCDELITKFHQVSDGRWNCKELVDFKPFNHIPVAPCVHRYVCVSSVRTSLVISLQSVPACG